jgi:hypothetical protein
MARREVQEDVRIELPHDEDDLTTLSEPPVRPYDVTEDLPDEPDDAQE